MKQSPAMFKMPKVLIKLMLSTAFVGALVVGCNRGENQPGRVETVTGQWHITLSPPAGATDGHDVTHEELFLIERNSQITGFAEPFHLNGKRVGNELELLVSMLDHNGSVLQHSYMLLHLESDSQGSGLGYTPVPVLGGDVEAHSQASALNRQGLMEALQMPNAHETYEVAATRVATLTATEVEAVVATAQGIETQSVLHDVCAAIGDIASFAIGILSDNAFRPMSGCWDDKDGGGFYAFGREGPGSALPAWTQTYYQPLEWSPCKSREYGFTISYDGSNLAGKAIDLFVNEEFPQFENWFEKLGFSDAASALDGAIDFYDTYGDFAIAAGFSTHTGSVSLYMILPSSELVAVAAKEPFIQRIQGKLAGGARGGFYFFGGPRVTDHFSLPRSVVPCGTNGVVFAYLIGTANVLFD